jgi:hypothetical protein
MDGSLATLDLSSASDRVTPHFVGNLFRCNIGLVMALQSTRTRYVEQNLDSRFPSKYALKKFSTMGSAVTFPVETLGFLSIALAATLVQRGLKGTMEDILSLEGQVAVFGDDIIVPTDSRLLLTRALEVLHFEVNVGKSFSEGNFRESCGVDAYKGIDISPVYWRSPCRNEPEEIASTLTVRNSFYRRGYWHAAAYLASTIPCVKQLARVPISSGAFGVESFLGLDVSGFQRRICRSLQKDQVRLLGMSAKQRVIHTGCDSVLLQFFTEDPDLSQPWAGGVKQRPRLRLCRGWVDMESLGS